ncbi:hypothetical protein DK853_37890, partial [Klebsiella oxytoca]
QQNYKDVNDPAVTIGFNVIGQEKTQLVVWTTTPWTLPSTILYFSFLGFLYKVLIKDSNKMK